MNVYLINLDRDKEKLRFMESQLARFGVLHERVSAVNGRTMSANEKHEVVNRFRWWCAIGLPARDAEIGCAMSHIGLYRRLVAGEIGESVCVLEDDVVLSENFKKAVDDVGSWIGNVEPRVVMLSDRVGQFANTNVQPSTFNLQPSSFAYCTDAYIINKKAAAALLRENYPLQRPCDHWAKWVRRGAIELHQYLPTVARQKQETFGTSTQEGLIPVSEWPLPKWAWFKSKRVIGKLLDKLLG